MIRPIRDRIHEATHREFTLRGVAIIELRGSRIARAADNMDVLGLIVQIGANVDLPGGAVLHSSPAGPRDFFLAVLLPDTDRALVSNLLRRMTARGFPRTRDADYGNCTARKPNAGLPDAVWLSREHRSGNGNHSAISAH